MPEEWISITEAAARLSAAGDVVDRSTLSRYLKQHSEALPLKPDGKSNLVEIGALMAHRQENIRIRTTTPIANIRGSRGAPQSRFQGSQSEGAARNALAVAELREMDLAERRQELTPVAEVDQGGRDAVALMQSAFERAIETEANMLSLKYGWDERTARIALKAFVRTGLEVFNREILLRLDAMKRESEAGGDEARRGESGFVLQ